MGLQSGFKCTGFHVGKCSDTYGAMKKRKERRKKVKFRRTDTLSAGSGGLSESNIRST